LVSNFRSWVRIIIMVDVYIGIICTARGLNLKLFIK